MKIALVHDYLLDFGGAERVFAELHKIYPDAPIYTVLVDKQGMGKFWSEFADAKVITSWFGKLPFASKLISPLRFLLPLIWNSFDFSKFDVVIGSASWAVTKGFKKGRNTIEICYLHTPPRYLYGYDTSRNWKTLWFSKLVELYALIVNHFMRQYDFNAAQRVDYFIANSKNTGKRIEKFYRRNYKVIYPPVEVEKIITSKVKPVGGNFYLAGGRLVAAKNFDLIIKACKEMKVKLKIFGFGILDSELKSLADESVEFLGKVTDEKLIALYKGAKAFILAQKDEDFGITPVEAAATGCPVIAFRGGGYMETVVDGVTGLFFEDLTVESLTEAMKRFEERKSNPKACISHAKNFSKERFRNEIVKFVKENYARATRG